MLYAKKDLYAEDPESGRRFQVAFAGNLVPAEFEHLVDEADVQEIATPADAAEISAEEPSVEERTAPGPEAPNATEAALELAEEHGLDIATVAGSGEGGRIVVGDVQKLVDAAAG